MIYLDNNATTNCDPLVLEEVVSFLRHEYGNPSSPYSIGREAKKKLTQAREQVAQFINCCAPEVIFTSCATEANNTILKGVANHHSDKGKHIITSAIEHPCVLATCYYLQKQGFEVTFLPVDSQGVIHPESLQQQLRSDTILVSLMHSNNEIGSLQPIAELARISKQAGVLFHTDASQSMGKVTIDVQELGVDFLTIAGHKMYAPKGIGAFFIRQEIEIDPLLHGGQHEFCKRAGTENVPYIIGLGKACEIAQNHMHEYIPKLQQLRDLLHHTLEQQIAGVFLNGHPEQRLCNTANLSFPGMNGKQILAMTPQVAASTSSACCQTSGSHVLKALGHDNARVTGSIRFSVGKYNTKEEILQAAELLSHTIKKIKNS